jgi:hypothetical protein
VCAVDYARVFGVSASSRLGFVSLLVEHVGFDVVKRVLALECGSHAAVKSTPSPYSSRYPSII